MFNPKFLDDISAKLSEAVANSPAKDVEKNARALLAQGFAKLDLVTREEFDVQAQLLARTQQKLADLEARVAVLEGRGKAGDIADAAV
ncbi:MAG: accessory factor UbiK family protein [Pseudomonadota bacterium]|jgi:BMFP domain-containing protein YqiC